MKELATMLSFVDSDQITVSWLLDRQEILHDNPFHFIRIDDIWVGKSIEMALSQSEHIQDGPMTIRNV